MREDHLIQQILCNDLEAVADRLPDLPSLQTIRRLGARLQLITSTHFDRAEVVLATLPAAQRPCDTALDAIRQMHRLDESHAQDLMEALWEHARRAGSRDVGQLAYMLRCFFDGCRRAIALKESWIKTG